MPATIVPSSETSGNSGGPVSSISVPLPSGLSIGQKILMVISAYVATPLSPPSGWSSVAILAGGCPTFIFERVVDGSEGSSVSVSLTRTACAAYGCVAIQDWDTGTPIEKGTLQGSGGSSSPNPLPVTPSWGAVDTLYIPVIGWRGSNAGPPTLVSYPSGYLDGQITDVCAAPYGTGIALCAHSSASGSDNPGAATLSGVAGTTCITLAVK